MFAILAAGASNDARVSTNTFRMAWKLPALSTVILAQAGLAARARTAQFSGPIIALGGTCGEDAFAYPYGLAVDGSGNLYVVDGESSLHTIPSGCNHLGCGGQLGRGSDMRKPSSHGITAAQ